MKRLLSLFSVIVLMCVSALADAQTAPSVTLSAKNETLQNVISSVEKQTGYSFAYSGSLIDVSKKVTVNLKDAALDAALKAIFAETGISYKVAGKQIALTPSKESKGATPTSGPSKNKITGKVVDENGAPFSFVDVFVTGTTNGTVTDASGKYELTVDSSAKSLTFNFMGYKVQNIEIGKKSVIDATLTPEANVIEETVVVAFGEQRKNALSAAVSTVKADDIIKAPVSNISNAVAGRIPGLIAMQSSGQPGQDESTMYIRGAGTWNDAEPLYVIDGVERNQSHYLRMDPSEIESFSILKDAAATAVYGSKGANGVVLITTKRGVEGKPKVTFNTSLTLNQPTRYPNYLNSYESLVLYNEALVNDGQEPLYSETELMHYKNHDDLYRYPDTDWYSLMMKDYAAQTNNSLSIRGGTKSVKYFFSGTYMYQDGQLKTSQGRIYDPKFGYQRYTFMYNMDVLLTPEFTLSVDISGGFTDQTQPLENTSIFTGMNRIPSWIMPAYYLDADGNRLYAGTTDFPTANPMYLLNTKGTKHQKHNTLNSSIKLSYDFGKYVKGLKFSTRVAYDSNFGNYGQWSETQPTYQLISQAGRADRYNQLVEAAYYTTGSGSTSATRKVYGEANLHWGAQFGNNNVSTSLISNISDYRSGTSLPYRSVSFIGRVNYSFKNKYFLEANGSYRGSENFAPGRRFGFFPSVSAGWNIHNESFIKNNAPEINNLKLRASYGLTGNDYANTRFIYKEGKWTTSSSEYARFGANDGSSVGITTEPSIANPLATWETARQTNIGLDVAIFQNKFSISIDRFFENRSGILMTPNSTPMILGIGITDMNIGKTKKNGWEFDAAYRQKFGRDFNFYVKGNLTTIHNEVVYKDEPESMLAWQKEEGRAIGQQYGYVVIGYFKDEQDIASSPVQQVGSNPIPGDFKYMDQNNDGVINEDDRVAIGYPKVPGLVFGATTGFTWKRFGLDVHFQGTAHSSVFISQYLMYEFYNRGRVQDIHQGRWTPETAETATYPALHVGATSQNHVKNSYFLKDNPYVRLKNVELSYEFKLKKTAAIKGLRVHMSGVNLFTWDKLKVVDPETPSGSTGAVYPQTRGYSLGANLVF